MKSGISFAKLFLDIVMDACIRIFPWAVEISSAIPNFFRVSDIFIIKWHIDLARILSCGRGCGKRCGVLSAAKAVHCLGSDQYSKDDHYNRPKELPLETRNPGHTNKNDYYADD